MMKSLSIFAALLLSANFAVAAEGGNDISEFHHHADMGVLEITPGITYMTSNQEFTGGAKNKIDAFDLKVMADYGLMHGLAVGGELGYVTGTFKTEPATTDTDIVGLRDLELFAKGHSDMGAGRLAYGATLNFSLGNQENKTGESTPNSGGMGLTPYVGYEMAVGPGIWGAQASYNWVGERTSETAGVESKTEGGSSIGLATFYEYAMGAEMSLGAALRYAMTSETENAGVGNNDEETVLGLEVYAPMAAGDGLELIPRFTWASTDSDTVGDEGTSDLSLGVDARWAF